MDIGLHEHTMEGRLHPAAGREKLGGKPLARSSLQR